ncbi:MAG: hypothetical protein H0W84_12050 [Bacteroidetes bacterium]|nr:hypothetical protein [Bacteroidota bacterium]
MNKKYFYIIASLHLLLVISDMIIYDYQQISDALRYVLVANEFISLNFTNLDPTIHCITAPGYPLFLAILKPFTQHNKYIIALFQSALYIFALYFLLNSLYKKGYLNYSACIISFAIVLFSPEIFQTNESTLSETLCGSFILVICGCLVTGFDKRINQILFIFSTCFLILSKFEYFLFLPVILIPLINKKSYKLLSVTLLSVGVILSINGFKNLMIYKKFNPFSYGSGGVIYGGNNLNGDGSWHKPSTNYFDVEKLAQYQLIAKLTPECTCVKHDSLFKYMAANAWKTDGVKQLKIIPLKFLKLWAIPATFDFYSTQTEFKKGLQLGSLFTSNSLPWYAKYKHGFYFAIYWGYCVLILFGFYFKIKINKIHFHDYFILLLFMIVSIMYSVPFYGLGRFHVPIFGLLAIYAVFSVKYLDNRFLKNKLFNKLDSLN